MMELVAEHPVRITNPDKLLWPRQGITKLDYISYIAALAPCLLRHLQDRPLTLVRCPDGIDGQSFYQKDVPPGAPEWVRTVPVWSVDRGGYIHYVIADSVATLIWLAQVACLEFHVGFTRWDAPDQPTSVAFDLDPSVPGFEPVREVALCLHELLQRLELPHVAKTSGASGLQVIIPLVPGHSFEDTRVFTKAVAEYVQRTRPRQVTLERLTKHRGDKVYIDYPQHGHNRTLIAAYSPRANDAALVSTPLRWTELEAGAMPEWFTLKTVPGRVQAIGDLLDIGPPVKLDRIVAFLRNHSSLML